MNKFSVLTVKQKYKILFSPLILVLLISFVSILYYSCTKNPDREKVITPENKIESGDLDKELVMKGKQIFNKKCMECHNLDVNLTGPSLRDVTKRRKAEWILRMILNTEEMIREDSIAKLLFREHVTEMTVKGVSEMDARAVLEYLKSVEK